LPGLVRQGHGKYCGYDCYHKSRIVGDNTKCIVCGKPFYAKPSSTKRGLSKYCSRDCMAIEYSKRKPTRFNGGLIEIPCSVCGEICYKSRYDINNKANITCSVECKHKRHSVNMMGDKSPSWKGGQIEKSCIYCGNVFNTARHNENNHLYCSKN